MRGPALNSPHGGLRRGASEGRGRLAPWGALLLGLAVAGESLPGGGPGGAVAGDRTPVTVAAPAGIPPSRPLRVVTFNLLHGGPASGWFHDGHALERRLELTAEGLRALDADVVGLQEASSGLRRGVVAERLARRLGLHPVYAPAFGGGPVSRLAAAVINFAEGPALLSRFPVVAWEALALPRCGRWYEPRVLLAVTLATPWGPLPAFSTHTAGDPCQTTRVAELVAARRGAWPGVLTGDFNAMEDSAAIQALTRAGFVDAFRAANPGAPGFTVWQPVTAPDRRARRRVDYVFLVPGRSRPGRVLASRLVLDAPTALGDGRVLWPSDHYGVLAEVEVFPPAGP